MWLCRVAPLRLSRAKACVWVQVLEKSEVVREGKDVVILTYSRMRWTVMQAVGELEKQVPTPPPPSVHLRQPRGRLMRPW